MLLRVALPVPAACRLLASAMLVGGSSLPALAGESMTAAALPCIVYFCCLRSCCTECAQHRDLRWEAASNAASCWIPSKMDHQVLALLELILLRQAVPAGLQKLGNLTQLGRELQGDSAPAAPTR